MNPQLIEQFVAGRMAEAEAEAFEEFCLVNPEFAKQVEVEQRLKAGLAQVARGSTSEFVRSGREDSWKFALAASVLLLIGAGAYLWQRSATISPHVLTAMQNHTAPSGASLRLALVRGAENVPVLPDGVVRIEIVGLFESGSRYAVVLDQHTKKGVETVAVLDGQNPSSPVKLEVLLDSDELASGYYSLHVTRTGSQDEPLDFGFVKP